MSLVKWLEKALAKTMIVSVEDETPIKYAKETRKIQVPPAPALVYGVLLAIVFFIGLLALEIAYLAVFRQFEQNIFNAMVWIVTFILGAFFGAKAS